MRQVDILGTKYTIEVHVSHEDNMLSECSGYCDEAKKLIVCADVNDKAVFHIDEEDKTHVYNKILRHEILHALLNESGLQENSTWARDETCVDWMAIMYPKMKKLFTELGIEG